MALFFIFKASGANYIETWYTSSEALPGEIIIAISANG
jgi:hypothetical protein